MSKVSTELSSIRVVPLEGDALDAKVFLRPDAIHGAGPGTLGSELNAEGRKFMPMSVGGEILLYRLSWIAYAAAEHALPELAELEEVGAIKQGVELTLTTGDVLSGKLVFLMPEQSSRVSDVLNSPGHQFLLLVSDGACTYVNREAIVCVRE